MLQLVPTAAIAFALLLASAPAGAATIEFFAAGTGNLTQDDLGLFGDADGSPASVRFHADDLDRNSNPDRGSYTIGFLEITFGPHVFQISPLPDYLQDGGRPLGFMSVSNDAFDDIVVTMGSEFTQGQTLGPQSGLLPFLTPHLPTFNGTYGVFVVLDADDGEALESDALPVPIPTALEGFAIVDLLLREPGPGPLSRLTFVFEIDPSTLTSRVVPEPARGLAVLAVTAALALARRRGRGV